MLFEKKGIKEWDLTYSRCIDAAKFNFNHIEKVLNFYTSDIEHYYVNIQYNFPSGAMDVLFSVKTVTKSDKSRLVKHLQR